MISCIPIEDVEKKVWFVRIKPTNLSVTIKEILGELAKKSWLNNISDRHLSAAFNKSSDSTIEYLKEKLKTGPDEKMTKEQIELAGQYIVSYLSGNALSEKFNHFNIPLMELLGRKKVGNPGLDFYTWEEDLIYKGEAKYKKGLTPYNDAIVQILDFIENKKAIQDIPLIKAFINSDNALDNLVDGIFGISIAFSSTDIASEQIIKNIKKNENFKKIKCSNIFLLAVDVYE